jgi:hypothetical protein
MTEQAIPASAAEADLEFLKALQDKEPQKPPRSQWRDVWDQFRKHKGAMFGGGFLIFITLAVIFGPYIWDIHEDAGSGRSSSPSSASFVLDDPGESASSSEPPTAYVR